MKKLSYFSVLLLVLQTASCRRQGAQSVAEQPKAQIEFLSDLTHDFGMYRTRDTMVHYFVYKNIGKVPFVINKVEPSCHCTRAYYSHQPLQPGQKDSIRITYDGDGFLDGPWRKSCTIYSNADTTFVLRIKGTYYAAE